MQSKQDRHRSRGTADHADPDGPRLRGTACRATISAHHLPHDEGHDELVLARAIPFRTLCEHHMLLFSGVAHVGYLPGERILGLSKLARLVGHFASRPQTQERLTMQVARCLEANLRLRGAGVVLEAGHTCMTQRGIRAHGATTVTSALLGTLRDDPRSRAEFFALARGPASPEPA
jgi:GTP cyclohydrolase I